MLDNLADESFPVVPFLSGVSDNYAVLSHVLIAAGLAQQSVLLSHP